MSGSSAPDGSFPRREILQKALNILDLCAAPAVDRLVIIAHDDHPAAVARQHPNPGILNVVGILELIHQHVGKAFAVVIKNVWLVEP